MSTNPMLPVVLIIILLVVTVLVLFLVKPRKGATGNSTQRKNNVAEKNAVIQDYNSLISEYNRKNAELSTAIKEKSREANLYCDDDAIYNLQKMVLEVNRKGEDIDDYFLRARECLSNSDVAGARYCIAAIRADLYLLEDMTAQVQRIETTPHTGKSGTRSNREQYQSQYRQTVDYEPNTLMYFKGCTTKEDIEARYRSLSKALHPDAKGGDTSAFQEMQTEYKAVMKGMQA